MNGHAQSGGHWNAAFGRVTTNSDSSSPPQWSSRSGNGSANGILLVTVVLSMAWRSGPMCCATRSEPERPRGGPHQFLYVYDSSLEFTVVPYFVSVQDCT